MKIHESITAERLSEALEAAETRLESPGFCIGCGVDADGIEPDARKYLCESCGESLVFGCEEILFMIA